MSEASVYAENLCFSYRIKHASANTIKQTFINSIKGINSDVYVDAISDVNFELKKGEILGIIGGNGAGKSTLLKLLAGILPPSNGSVRVQGQVAPLIELGAGFNPELTGAENIILFGVLLGNSRTTMRKNVAPIADWAGLTDSIHLPLRTYSTGMLSRLGFAVATFQKCELLIIDEVLSVGDSDFQTKSLARMEEFIFAGEITILVSHDIDLIKQRTSKALWLERGKQVMFGNSKDVVDAYRAT